MTGIPSGLHSSIVAGINHGPTATNMLVPVQSTLLMNIIKQNRLLSNVHPNALLGGSWRLPVASEMPPRLADGLPKP